MPDWTTLDELPAGTLFETNGGQSYDGCITLKTEYTTERHSVIGGNRWLEPDCYIVGSGERYCPPGGAHPAYVAVRPIEMPPSPELLRRRADEYRSLLNRPCTLAVTNGRERYGVVLNQDERGVWFRGKLERDNPNERERTYFVPWGSIVWLEMEEE